MKPSDLLFSIGRPVAYYPSLAKPLGSVNACLFFCQIFYWQDKTQNELGVYKTAEEIEQETGLTYREQATARKLLVERGVLIETHKRLDHKIFYRIDTEKLNLVICGMCNPRNAESAIGEATKPQFDLCTENTTETTTDIKDMSVSAKHDGSVSEIFAYWQSAMNSPRSKLGADKKKKILTALKTYSVEEIKKAILGCAMTPFNMGDNDQQTKYNGLELILRNSEKIDKFISHADNPPAARKQKQVIDNNDTSWGKDFGDIY